MLSSLEALVPPTIGMGGFSKKTTADWKTRLACAKAIEHSHAVTFPYCIVTYEITKCQWCHNNVL